MLTNATSDMHKNAAQGNSMKMQHKISMHGYATHKNATKRRVDAWYLGGADAKCTPNAL